MGQLERNLEVVKVLGLYFFKRVKSGMEGNEMKQKELLSFWR